MPERFWFWSRAQRQNQWTVIVDMDQSGSMADSVVYGAVTGSIFASLPALNTRVVVPLIPLADAPRPARNLNPVFEIDGARYYLATQQLSAVELKELGGKAGSRPEQQGFDESLGFISGAAMYLPEKDKGVVNAKQPWDPIDRFLWPNLPYMVQFNGSKMFAPKGYMTDYLTDEAIKSIKANKNRPFFIYFAPNAIHTPLQAKKEDYDALPQIKDHRLRVYGAMARNLDHNVGRILQTLKDEGLDDNTLVIFTSDNGGAGYIGLPDVNRPYRGFKSTFFEGGIHAPFFMRYPGVIKAGTQFAPPVGHIDIFATAAGAAGAKVPTDRVVDGVNLLPYFAGKATGRPHQVMFWRSGQYQVVRDGDWKLQVNGARNKIWLFDLAKDPTEKVDLSTREPARVKAMQALLAAQNAQTVKPMWPSLLQGPVFVDHPSGVPQKPGEAYILWDN